jgi:hypothetical protein
MAALKAMCARLEGWLGADQTHGGNRAEQVGPEVMEYVLKHLDNPEAMRFASVDSSTHKRVRTFVHRRVQIEVDAACCWLDSVGGSYVKLGSEDETVIGFWVDTIDPGHLWRIRLDSSGDVGGVIRVVGRETSTPSLEIIVMYTWIRRTGEGAPKMCNIVNIERNIRSLEKLKACILEVSWGCTASETPEEAVRASCRGWRI